MTVFLENLRKFEILHKLFTEDNCINSSASFWLVHVAARYFSSVVDGGVVISRNLVNKSLTVADGILSCLSHVLTNPVKYILSY